MKYKNALEKNTLDHPRMEKMGRWEILRTNKWKWVWKNSRIALELAVKSKNDLIDFWAKSLSKLKAFQYVCGPSTV